jgi:hypothetical protein
MRGRTAIIDARTVSPAISRTLPLLDDCSTKPGTDRSNMLTGGQILAAAIVGLAYVPAYNHAQSSQHCCGRAARYRRTKMIE